MLHSHTFSQKRHHTARETAIIHSTFSRALCLSQAGKVFSQGKAFTCSDSKKVWRKDIRMNAKPAARQKKKKLDQKLRMLFIFPVCKPKAPLAPNYTLNFCHIKNFWNKVFFSGLAGLRVARMCDRTLSVVCCSYFWQQHNQQASTIAGNLHLLTSWSTLNKDIQSKTIPVLFHLRFFHLSRVLTSIFKPLDYSVGLFATIPLKVRPCSFVTFHPHFFFVLHWFLKAKLRTPHHADKNWTNMFFVKLESHSNSQTTCVHFLNYLQNQPEEVEKRENNLLFLFCTNCSPCGANHLHCHN